MSKNQRAQVVNKKGYWTYRFRDADGGEHTLTFGSVNKVPKGQADAELQRTLLSQRDPDQKQNSGFLAVEEIGQAFLEWAEQVYVREDKSPTGEAQNLMHGLQPLLPLFGKLPCVYIRPRHIKEFCEAQIVAGVSRSMINKRIGYIRRMLLWAKNEELLPPVKGPGDAVPVGAFDACRDFPLLRSGRPVRTGGKIPRETDPVKSVAEETVNQTAVQLVPTIQNMIQLQLLCSMRPAEVCWLKMSEVDTTQDPWLYMPSRHKTKHHGKERRIYLGPKAREILKPYRLRRQDAFVFRPADAKAEGVELDMRAGGDQFSTRTYRDAIWHACDRAFPAPEAIRGSDLELRRHKAAVRAAIAANETPPQIAKGLEKRAKEESAWMWAHRWSPNQLRHSGLTEIVQREMAKATERAKAVAGHGSRHTTRTYIDPTDEMAAAIMEQSG